MTPPSGRGDGPLDFDGTYARFGAAIYARCRQMLRDPAAAEDVTQEAFLRIHRQLARVRGPREALVWLFRTATNLCLNEIRAGRHRPVPVSLLPELAGPAPESSLAAHDLVARLCRALPEPLVVSGWLYHVDGLDQAEIAEICGVSRRTIVKRVSAFEEQARAYLEEAEHVRIR
jgi:RNA polymerase sigma-70 factor (ECF subfamily)